MIKIKASFADSLARSEGWCIMTSPQTYLQRHRVADRKPTWPTYVGITGLLLLILITLAGGIIWYNSTKSNELAIAAAKRLIKEAEAKILERVKLLYDPVYAVIGIASLVPQLTSTSGR